MFKILFMKSKYYHNLSGQYGVFRPSPKTEYHHIKSIREDFNDMFSSEVNYRKSIGDESLVFCLTYNDDHLRTYCGQNVVDCLDLQLFAKSSVFSKTLERIYKMRFDMLSIGEFGEGGVTHHFNGKRGKGQNPHFHCAGFFHKLGDADKYVIAKYWSKRLNISLKNALRCNYTHIDLLVYTWQGCFERDIHIYGRSKYLRSLGLGHVELSGEVISPYAGGSYYSKYIGKDIKSIVFQAYKNSFLPRWHDRALEVLADLISIDDVQSVYDIWLNLSQLWHWSELPKKDCLFEDMRKCSTSLINNLSTLTFNQLERVISILHDNYIAFYNDFMIPFKTRYSPKLRKFHQFGWSLTKDCDQLKGTYTILRKNGVVSRQLPPSLYRLLYYSYVKLPSKNSLSSNPYSVKYFLNATGVKHLNWSLIHKRQVINDVIKQTADPQLINDSSRISTFITCFYTRSFPVVSSVSFVKLLSDFDLSCKYIVSSLSNKKSICSFSSHHVLIDYYLYIKEYLPSLYFNVNRVINILHDRKVFQDTNDRLYMESWHAVYKSNL